jgi:hypothetical protein
MKQPIALQMAAVGAVQRRYHKDNLDASDNMVAALENVKKTLSVHTDLLEALERFVKFVDDQKLEYESSMVIQAKLAIQKAKS